MANETQIYGHIKNKHDLEVNWLKAVNFTPKDGELIVYEAETFGDPLPDDRATYYTTPRLKIGNGKTNVNDLPFVTSGNSEDSAAMTLLWQNSSLSSRFPAQSFVIKNGGLYDAYLITCTLTTTSQRECIGGLMTLGNGKIQVSGGSWYGSRNISITGRIVDVLVEIDNSVNADMNEMSVWLEDPEICIPYRFYGLKINK